MNEYLVLASSTAPYDLLIEAGELHAYADTGEHDGRRILTLLNPTGPTQPGDDLVGGWDMHGNRVVPLNQELYDAIRPLGNAPERVITDESGEPVDVIPAGEATRDLLYSYWDGWRKRALGDEQAEDPVMRLYPQASAPFEILVEQYWYEQNEWSGWGFLAEIKGGAASRDPTNRAIGVYSDEDCQQYLWTGGAFQLGPSRLGQVDENGDPIEVYYTECPAGRRHAEKEPWHLACLHGSLQEGRITLEGDPVLLMFWEHNQPSPPDVAFLRAVYAEARVASFTHDLLTDAEKIEVRHALRNAGVPAKQIAACKALTGTITHREAFTRLLRCIHRGVIVWPLV